MRRWFLSYNSQDIGLVETVDTTLRRKDPDARFHVFSYYPADDKRLLRDSRISIKDSTPLALVAWLLPWSLIFGFLRLLLGRRICRYAPSSVRALAESEALVDLAGVAFIDGRGKFLPFNILTVLPAILLGTPVVKMPQAMGPFANPVNRLAAKLILPRCRMVWARGSKTFAHLSESGFDGLRFAQADDIAFNFDAAWALTNEGGARVEATIMSIRRLRGERGIRGIIGICPSSVLAVQARKRDGNYEQTLSRMLSDLAADGFGIVLFPNATRDEAGEAERNNDLPVMRRLRDAARAAGVPRTPVLVDYDLNAAAIKQVIAACDVLLVSRFHAMVGALSLGVPTVVLGWSHKYAEVMARFDLDDVVMDYQVLAPSELLEAVRSVFECREQMRNQILARLPEVKQSSARPLLGLLEPSLGADLA